MTLEVFSKSGTTSFPADAFENSETNHRKQSGYDRENSQDKTLLVKFFIKNRVSLYRNYVFNTFICPCPRRVNSATIRDAPLPSITRWP